MVIDIEVGTLWELHFNRKIEIPHCRVYDAHSHYRVNDVIRNSSFRLIAAPSHYLVKDVLSHFRVNNVKSMGVGRSWEIIMTH